MCKKVSWILGLWLAGAGQLLAQPAPTTGAAAPGAAPSGTASPTGSQSSGSGGDGKSTSPGASGTSGSECVPLCGLWARPEYLLWWVKKAPLPVPVVTTGDPSVGFDPNNARTVNTAGAIGQRGTLVLFGDGDVGWRVFSGMRLTAGGWLDHEGTFGLEGSGFVIEHLTNSFSAASDKTGNPPLYFPDLSATAGASGPQGTPERAIPIADPLRRFSGAVAANSTLRLFGAECDGVVTLVHDCRYEILFLTGFRYADLLERLRIASAATDLIFGNSMLNSDSFDTRNQFYGGQVGTRVTFRRDCCTLEFTGKTALGSTSQVVEILGTTTQGGTNPLTPPGPGTFPGGVFAQKSNIGQTRSGRLSVLSSLELKLGYDLGPRSRAFLGYDCLWWNRVVRPGDQIDRTLNLTQNAVLDPNGSGTLVGPARPLPLFNRSDFWAQGISIGLEFLF